MKKSRAFCFTYNNPVAFDYDAIPCKYIIVGNEIAPETKTPHHQGYVMFQQPKHFKPVQKLLPKGCHIEPAKGSPQQNITYCSKESVHFEKGVRPCAGKRNDIKKIKEVINNGGGMKQVIEITDSFQAMRCAELILKYNEKPRDEKPLVKWFHGGTGTGKTKSAFEESKDPWVSGRSLKWWDGYDAHEHVIIDDFRRDFCTFHELLRILDRYPYRIENKGGSRQLLATQIIITCPDPPDVVYETREDVQQLLRRIDEVRQF